MNAGYLTNFIVYAFAMSGVLLTAVFVYKKFCAVSSGRSQGKTLKVKDSLVIAPRKTLYVVQVGAEEFLIAGDAERTTMLSKLNADAHAQETEFKTEVYAQSEYNITNKKVLQRLNERFKS